MYGGLRASGPKADIALVVAEDSAAAAGAFTTNIMCAAPVTYCREVLSRTPRMKAVSGPPVTSADKHFYVHLGGHVFGHCIQDRQLIILQISPSCCSVEGISSSRIPSVSESCHAYHCLWEMLCRLAVHVSQLNVLRKVLINAGQANAATGDAGYQDCLESADAVAQALGITPDEVLLLSTGVIGRCIKMDALKAAVPKLAASLGTSVEDAHHAAVAITTTDLVSKSAALEVCLWTDSDFIVG